MAVSIIENWTELEGEVLTLGPAPEAPRFRMLTMRVSVVRSVESFANLLADAVGSVVQVHVPRELIEKSGVEVGARVVCRVRRAGLQKLFAHPDRLQVSPSR